MDRFLAAAFDEATIILLRATSSPEALARVADEEARGWSAYPREPRAMWDERVCAAPDCYERFTGPAHKRYCTPLCGQRVRERAYWERKAEREGRVCRPYRRRAVILEVVARRRVA